MNYARNQREIVQHLLYDCEKSVKIWKILNNGLEVLALQITGDKRGYPSCETCEKYKMISIINLTAKMIIYINRDSSTDLHLKQVKMVMRYIFLIEKYWTSTSEKLPSFLGVWHPVYTDFLNFGTLLWKVISSLQ